MASALMHHGLESAADRFPGRTALLLDESSLSFAELNALSNAFAHVLAERGVTKGDRVAMMLTNRLEFSAALHGVSKLGAAAILISPAWKSFEVAHAVSLTDPAFGIADGSCLAVLAEVLGPEHVLDLDGEAAPGLLSGHVAAPSPPEISATDEAVLVFSSGTTDRPKAVRHTHHSIGRGTDHWIEALGLTADDRFQIVTPPSHILGALNLLAAAKAGSTVRLHRRFDLDESLRRVASDRLTLEMAVAPIALAMANHPDLESHDLSSLRYIMWGATPVTASVAELVTKRTGVPWLPAYGASEVPVIACNPVTEPDAWRLDSVGKPVGDVTLRVADLETGEILASGGIGEIQISSESTMAGYLPEEASTEAFADGWYRTGDVGWLEPDGWVHLTDRCKEMIKVSGFQVAPAEIEAVLLGHPDVVDCAVFSVDDERAGEVPVAAVVLATGATTRPEDLQALVADTLASYKRLRRVLLVDAIPRLASGKALRRELRDEWAEQIALELARN